MTVPGTWPHLLLIGVFVALTSTTSGSGLHCYECSYNELESDAGVASSFLAAISSLNDRHCLLEKVSDQKRVHERACPKPEPGKVSKCVVLKGTITITVKLLGILASTVKYHSVVRDCIEVDPASHEYSDGCHDNVPSKAHNVISRTFNTLKVGDLSFNGKVCYSSGAGKSKTLDAFLLCAAYVAFVFLSSV